MNIMRYVSRTHAIVQFISLLSNFVKYMPADTYSVSAHLGLLDHQSSLDLSITGMGLLSRNYAGMRGSGAV